MKKLIICLAAMFMLIMGGTAMAAGPVENFNKENKVAETIMNSFNDAAVTYAAVSGDLAPALKEKFTAKEFEALGVMVKDKFGRSKEVKFVSFEHFDKADKLVYFGNFSKENIVMITFLFDNSGRKPLLTDVTMLPLMVKEDGSLALKPADK